MKLKLFAICLAIGAIFLFGLSLVPAEQPTQQFNKIYLDPLYRELMEGDTDYSYNLTVDTPDGISEVQNAMITFQVWHNPTIRYYLWVNGQECNNPSFLVHTSYANAGEGTIFFDCTNVITREGVYEITLRPDDDLGTITGWIDLTYMNDPNGEFEFFGTEYRPGEKARIFLQLRDNQGLPENQGACSIDVYYPERVNSTADHYIINAPMLHLEGSNGLYYYDITTLPNETGVYMMTAGCSAELSSTFVYYTDGMDSNFPARTEVIGTYASSPIGLNAYVDYIYTSCTSTGGATKKCQAIYDFDTSVHALNTSNVTNLLLFYMGEASINALLEFEAYNFTSGTWYHLPNNLTFSGHATGGSPTGLNDFVSNHIPDEGFINASGIIRIRVTASSGTGFNQYDNWLNINLKTASGIIQELKGSGEIHINDWFDHYRQSYVNATWEDFNGTINYNVLNQTAHETTSQVWNYSGNVSTNIITQFVNAIWNYTGTISSTILDAISYDVWTNDNRNLTYTEDVTNYTLINEGVWSYSDRQLTAFNFIVNTTDINLTAQDVWEYSSRNLTYTEPVTVDYAVMSDYVWNNTDRQLTDFTFTIDTGLINLSAEDVWTYVQRNLTYYPPSTDKTNYSLISVGVWNYTNRELTGFDFEIDTGLVNLTADDVWGYTDRNLTYYEDVTNYSLISLGIWNETDRTLTAFDFIVDTTNYNLTEAGVWEYGDRNLTYYEPTNTTAVAAGTWNYSGRYTHGIIVP